jgi:hypothetical protein
MNEGIIDELVRELGRRSYNSTREKFVTLNQIWITIALLSRDRRRRFAAEF